MAEPEKISEICAYLEEHRATYEREALRRKLLADGFTADVVDLAMTRVYGSADTGVITSKALGKPLLYYLLIIGILFVNVLVLPALLKYVYETQRWWPPWAPPYGRVVLVAPVEWLLAWVLRRFAAPSWLSQAVFRAVLLYLVFLPVWFGVCVSVVGQNFAG